VCASRPRAAAENSVVGVDGADSGADCQFSAVSLKNKFLSVVVVVAAVVSS